MGTGLRLAAFAMFLALAAALPPAQVAPQLEWVRQYGGIRPADDRATAVDADGNVYVAGTTGGSLAGIPSTRGRWHPVIRK